MSSPACTHLYSIGCKPEHGRAKRVAPQTRLRVHISRTPGIHGVSRGSLANAHPAAQPTHARFPTRAYAHSPTDLHKHPSLRPGAPLSTYQHSRTIVHSSMPVHPSCPRKRIRPRHTTHPHTHPHTYAHTHRRASERAGTPRPWKRLRERWMSTMPTRCVCVCGVYLGGGGVGHSGDVCGCVGRADMRARDNTQWLC